MSLLLPSVQIALTPDRVAVSSGKTYRESGVASPGWTGSLKTLTHLLKESPLKGRARVVLSHHFSHVHLLPAPPVLLKSDEMQGWIREYLSRLLGEPGMNLQVAWQTVPPGKPILASSLSLSAMEEIVDVIKQAGLKPATIQPWFVASWNRVHRQFGKQRGWYALIEPGRLILTNVARREIRSLRGMMVQDEPVAAVSDLIKRETLLTGETTPSSVWIDSIMLRADWRALEGGLAVHPLTSGSDSLASMLGT